MTSTEVTQQRTRRYLDEMDPDFRSARSSKKRSLTTLLGSKLNDNWVFDLLGFCGLLYGEAVKG